VRVANEEMLPQRTQAARVALDAQIADAAQVEAQRPIRNQIAMDTLTAEKDLTPDKIAIAAQNQKAALEMNPGKIDLAKKAQIDAQWAQLINSSTSQANGEDAVLGHVGRTIASGDNGATTMLVQKLFASPMFPATNGLPKPASTMVVDRAPEGTMDARGEPLKGKALKVTLEGGDVKYMSMAPVQAAYGKWLGAQQQAAIKEVKPGSVLVDTRTNQELFSNNNGFVEDENGNLVRPGRGAGAGLGVGGKGGKASVDAVTTALSTILKESSEKLTPDQVASAQVYAQRATDQGTAKNPQEAAQIAVDAARNPGKITTKLNLETGEMDDYYQDPDKKIADGRKLQIAAGTKQFADIAKVMDKADVQANAKNLLAKMGKPEAQSKFLRAAVDTVYREQMIQAAQGAGADVAALTRKLDILRYLPEAKAFTPKPTGGVTPSTAPAKAGANAVGGTAPSPVAGDDASYEDWVNSKLMGVFDGPNALQKIARTNPNPKIQAAAQRLYERAQQAKDAPRAESSQPL